MFQAIFTIILFLSCFNNLQAQSRTDSKLRLENSFVKLYENPDTAIHAANEIKNADNRTEINDLLTQAYHLKGDYAESVRLVFATEQDQIPALESINKLMLAREFYVLKLYQQSLKITRLLISERDKKNDTFHQIYRCANPAASC